MRRKIIEFVNGYCIDDFLQQLYDCSEWGVAWLMIKQRRHTKYLLMLPCSPLTIILSLFFYPVSHCILLNTTSYFRLPLFCSSAIAGFMMCNDEVIRFFLISADFFIIFIISFISLVSSRSSSIARCRLETRDLLKLQGSVLINHAASRR